MPLTPIDVQQKTFGTALRGYDLDEVDDFLDEIVTSLKDYEQRLRDAQERIATLEVEMNDRGDTEGAIARALVAAQRSADSIVADAKAEADRIVGQARAEASELQRVRDDEKAAAESEIGRIRSVVERLRADLAEFGVVIGHNLEEADVAVSGALGDLDEPAFLAPEDDALAAEDVEPARSAWANPDDDASEDEYASEDDDSQDDYEDVDDSQDDSADFDDDSQDDSQDEFQDDTATTISSDWTHTDGDDEQPVRPWEIS